ncbi:MAG: helix-turn-helix domain-containing protein, partial [Anaerolineales bacterium]|nr:helix-turn-helix domain-containing protein [Anaerolineales bacterium]
MGESVQPLLSVGKKSNHFFSFREHVEDLQQDRVTLIWGGVPFVSYLEKDQKVIPNALAVGLVAAGMRQTDVSEVLGINPRQLQRYVRGDTSLEKNPGRPPVVTEEIGEFVKEEYTRICSKGPRRWRREVSEAVVAKFHLTLKPSTLSALVAELSGGSSSTKGDEGGDSRAEELCMETEKEEWPGEAETLPESPATESELSDSNCRPTVVPLRLPEDPTEVPEALKRPGAIGPEEGGFTLGWELLEERLRQGIYSRYAGGFLLNPFIARMMEGVLKEERPSHPATQISFQSYLLT